MKGEEGRQRSAGEREDRRSENLRTTRRAPPPARAHKIDLDAELVKVAYGLGVDGTEIELRPVFRDRVAPSHDVSR